MIGVYVMTENEIMLAARKEVTRAGCEAVKVITDTGRRDSRDRSILQGTATCAGKIVQIEQVSEGMFTMSDNKLPGIDKNLENLVAGMCLGSECPNFVQPTQTDLDFSARFASEQ